jgi:hypothetical protein
MMGAMFETFEMFVFEVFVVWFGGSAIRRFCGSVGLLT